MFEMIRMLMDLTAMLVFGLSILIVALGAVVYRLQKGWLVLFHHIGGAGTAATNKKNRWQFELMN